MNIYRAGVDIGSTTVKLVILDAQGRMLRGEYRRHRAHTQETLARMLRDAREQLGACQFKVAMTGSGAISLSKALETGFVQEVVAVASALRREAPQTDVAIELGGEDAKIIYFSGGLEERMNGVCAGGTGSFIDQMAALLKTDARGLNELARHHRELYPIAARCGVFAKTDIQPLINEGAAREDLAASIFQAVVNQTISGLACGKPIRGCVAFLGGPLHFLDQLRAAFIRTLRLTEETAVIPENSHLFAALGAAMAAEDCRALPVDSLLDHLTHGVMMSYGLKRLPPLFRDHEEYAAFQRRHSRAQVKRGDLTSYRGDCFLGIDAGSTTTKVALVGHSGQLLFDFYAGNQGSPIETARRAMAEIARRLPDGARIVRSCATGYGEELLKSAFRLDEGEVETIAHTAAASFFDPVVDCVLDIGGQDMKCIKLRNGSVDTILLNEACSSGCGSFLENFAESLGYTAEGFAAQALFAQAPVDLGTRCTVFMNSNVKQAQKEGASVQDISAGLACSVIKNALFKVIKLSSAADLGRHVVVQGGAFHNQAVLRAFEQLSGMEAVCPDIAGLMGAFGAALIARERYTGQPTATLPIQDILALTYTTRTARCGRCVNNCMLTVSRFPDGRSHITGNRCEKGLGVRAPSDKGLNVAAYKLERLFRYPPLQEDRAYRGVIGIPRVLNLYENYPFWATFFSQLGFRVHLSPPSSRAVYELGMASIPSESECYPAKLAHGHAQWLIDQGVQLIFHPCVFYERQEDSGAQIHYNCPIVSASPENLNNNVEDIDQGKARILKPFIAFTSEKTAADRLTRLCREEWGIPERDVRAAVHTAWEEQLRAKADIWEEGRRALAWMEEHQRRGIVLAGRPYHIDPEISHGIPELIASYGLAVLTEDSIPAEFNAEHPLRVTDQWVYHTRLYRAAEFVRTRADLELIQLNSFGCGLDAVTTDQVAEILEKSGKLYTVLKIDEVNSLGAARIRLRSLLAAMAMREKKGVLPAPVPAVYHRTEFTRDMYDQGYTILAPKMSPLHFDMLEPLFRHYGYHVVMLDNDGRSAVDMGLQYVNNDACYPSIIVVGQMMEAVLSGRYDVSRLALAITQTGGCCRASNYVGFIRRALEKAGLAHIPVISINANGMEKNSGFRPPVGLLLAAAKALVVGDLLMRCLYRVRPYEVEAGSADRLVKKWQGLCVQSLLGQGQRRSYGRVCRELVADFDALPIHEDVRKPRVGVVGEILVKYMPMANNHLVALLEREGAEAVVPDLMDFLNYCAYNGDFKHEYLGASWTSAATAHLGVAAIRALRAPALDALRRSRRFEPPAPIRDIARMAEPLISLGNQYGEGWFLTGEMAELLHSGVDNIVCIQPFACLPNHVVGKGVIKKLRRLYPHANIAAVDFDPGASEVNQLNRIKLMLSVAKERARESSAARTDADMATCGGTREDLPC